MPKFLVIILQLKYFNCHVVSGRFNPVLSVTGVSEVEEGELTAPQELTLQSHTMGRMTFGKEPGVKEVGPSMQCNYTFSWSQHVMQSHI